MPMRKLILRGCCSFFAFVIGSDLDACNGLGHSENKGAPTC